MKVRFTKMQGAGNDFVVIDNVRQNLHISPGQVRRLANRQRGIGCDQVLIVSPPDSPDADFRYHIFNADGSEAGHGVKRVGSFARVCPSKCVGQVGPLVRGFGPCLEHVGDVCFQTARRSSAIAFRTTPESWSR